MNNDLADELVTMAEEQLAAQAPLVGLMETDETFARWATDAKPTLLCAQWASGAPPEELAALWTMHDRHDVRLIDIVETFGWPGRTLAGEDGADAAWVIAQHADRHHAERREWLPLLKEAVSEREADPRHLARLLDRVSLVDDGKQQFGTWAQLHNGEVVFDPPADGSLADVEARRHGLGLPPLVADLSDASDAAPYRYMRTTAAYRWPT